MKFDQYINPYWLEDIIKSLFFSLNVKWIILESNVRWSFIEKGNSDLKFLIFNRLLDPCKNFQIHILTDTILNFQVIIVYVYLVQSDAFVWVSA